MRRLDINTGAVLLGAALLIFSMAGLYIDTNTAQNNAGGTQIDGQPVKVLRRVYHPMQITQPAPTAVPGATIANDTFLVPATPPPTNVPAAPPQTAAPTQAVVPPQGLVPQRIAIPAIQLDAPVVPASYLLVQVGGQVFQQWEAPDGFAAGWQQSSASFGVSGNTVLNGHHNIYGLVFGRLIYLKEGDTIQVSSGNWVVTYQVTNKMILPERGQDLSVRLDNARWMLPTSDERLTLVTCWPPNTNTHRLLIVARPVQKQMASGGQSP